MKPRIMWARQRANNFGDALNVTMCKHLLGEEPLWVGPRYEAPFGVMIGSFVKTLSEHAIVMGTGIILTRDKPNPEAHYLFVRGPLTKKAIRRQGGECPDLYCDLGMLIDEVYPCLRTGTRLGIIPHWREKDLPWLQEIDDPAIMVLDIELPPEEFLRRLWFCDCVLSSSLHGLIAAHAYNIPAAWIKLSDRPRGDGVKYKDYLLSVNNVVDRAHDVKDRQGISLAYQHADVARPNYETLAKVPALVQSVKHLISG